jgi:hypothetical protein
MLTAFLSDTNSMIGFVSVIGVALRFLSINLEKV